MPSSYMIELYTPAFQRMHVLTTFVSLKAGRSLNGIGKLELRIRGDAFPAVNLQPDTRILINRSVNGSDPILVGNTHYFLDRVEKLYITDDAYDYVIYAHDVIQLLERRKVAYLNETLYADKTIEEGNDGPADDLMHAFVAENFGSAALDTTRRIDEKWFTTMGSRGVAASTEKRASFRTVLSVLRDLVRDASDAGTELYFDLVVGRGPDLTFQTSVGALGVNRGRGSLFPVIFSPHHGNLKEPVVAWDYQEMINYVYVGGTGNGAGRLLVEVQDETSVNQSPYARREAFEDARDYDVPSFLQALGRTVLANNRAKLVVEAKAIDSPGARFGLDYFFGDRVVVSLDDGEFDCLVRAFQLSVNGGTEEIDVQLYGEQPL